MGPARLILWDISRIGSLNRRQWQESGFEIPPLKISNRFYRPGFLDKSPDGMAY
jgi:hypothetical protein